MTPSGAVSPLHEVEALVSSSRHTVVVAFTSPGCRPCDTLVPVLSSLASGECPAEVRIIDTASDAGAGLRYGIASIPTVLVFRDGVIRARMHTPSLAELEAAVAAVA